VVATPSRHEAESKACQHPGPRASSQSATRTRERPVQFKVRVSSMILRGTRYVHGPKRLGLAALWTGDSWSPAAVSALAHQRNPRPQGISVAKNDEVGQARPASE